MALDLGCLRVPRALQTSICKRRRAEPPPGQGATEVHFLFTIVAGGSFAASATGSITGRGLGRALSNR